MSFNGHPEWDVAHNRISFLRLYDLSLDRVVAAGLAHTANVKIVGGADARRGAREFSSAPPETDALLTRETNLVLMTTHADCMPVWLYAPASGWIGLAHVGWRGLAAGVVRNLIEAVPEDERAGVTVAIGPGIGVDHYEVSGEVAARFRADATLAPAVVERDGRTFLDLLSGAKLQAEAAGAAVNTEAFACTFSHEYLSSRRRDGESFAPMAAIITRTAP